MVRCSLSNCGCLLLTNIHQGDVGELSCVLLVLRKYHYNGINLHI